MSKSNGTRKSRGKRKGVSDRARELARLAAAEGYKCVERIEDLARGTPSDADELLDAIRESRKEGARGRGPAIQPEPRGLPDARRASSPRARRPPAARRDRISSDSKICHGHPCFAGTRVLVSVVLADLAEGDTVEQILASYPALEGPDDLRAALEYAAELAQWRVMRP